MWAGGFAAWKFPWYEGRPISQPSRDNEALGGFGVDYLEVHG